MPHFRSRALMVIAFLSVPMLSGGSSAPLCARQSDPPSAEAPETPSTDETPSTESSEQMVAATVDGQPIHAEEVKRQVTRALRGRPLEAGVRASFEARALAQLIDRRLIVRYLDKFKFGATPAQVALARARLDKQLQRQGRTLKDYYAANHMDESQLDRDLAWEIGWRRYLDRYLTDKNLEQYFDRHRRQFDGGRVRVAHILLRVKRSKAAEAGAEIRKALDNQISRARGVRADIVADKVSFADAARRHSDSPTGKDGGELGWIERDQPMPEPFSAAAFALKVEEISQPVASPFGVHLILCREIMPGDKSWRDVEDALRAHMTRYLFDWTASRQRAQATIRFSGAVPYLDPQTGRLRSARLPTPDGPPTSDGPPAPDQAPR